MNRIDFLSQISPRYKTVGSAYLARAVIVLCKLITVPLLLLYLPREEYAVLAILGGLEAWFLLLDFGLGTGLQNTIAESMGQGVDEESSLRTALVIGLGLLVLIALLLYFLNPLLSDFFLREAGSPDKARRAFLFTGSFFLLGTWASLATKVLTAREKGYQAYLVQSIAYAVSSVCMVVLAWMGKLSLFSCLFFSLGLPHLASCILGIKVFYRVRWIGPLCPKVLRRAGKFGLFSLLAALVTLSDSLTITRTLSLEEIIEYNVLCKIFGVASFLYAAFLQGLMPECTRNLHRGRVKEVETMIYRHCLAGIIGVLIFTCLVWSFSSYVEKFFSVSLGKAGICFFGFYLCVRVVADFYGMALQSHSKLKPFFYLVPVQAVLSIGLQYFFSIHFGVPGILAGLTFSYLCTVCWALPGKLRQLSYG